MTQTATATDTDRSNGHHAGQGDTQDTAQIDALALAIHDDLMSETPTFDYDLAASGDYARQLGLLMDARRVGLEQAQGVVDSIKLRPGSELAQLLARRERIALAQDNRPSIPALPTSAIINHPGFLPSMCSHTKKWFDQWDSEQLRKVSPWLRDYISYSRLLSPEGYLDFHIACALWVLSTVAARRIYVPLADRVYTPLAIALVARTSLFAKTTTAKAGLNVMKAAGLAWLLGDDETTPQRLLSDMAGHIPTNYAEMDSDRQEQIARRLAMSGQVGWYYDEFNQLLNAMMRSGPMADFAGLLRKLDNCPDEYRYSTKGGGQEVISQPYLPLLANTTPANLRKHASKGDEFWGDGFWARFAFITPPADAWVTETMSMGEVSISPALTEQLKNWNTRLGVPACHIEEVQDEKGHKTGRYRIIRDDLPSHPIMIDQDAYQSYLRYREALRSLIAESGSQDLDGSYTRLADKALRIAALLGSLENENRIDFDIWTLAQEIAEMLRRNLHELYSQVSTAQEESPLDDKLIAHLKTLNAPASVRELLQRGPRDIRRLKAQGIRDLLLNLASCGIVECKSEGKKELYSLIKDEV